MFQWFKFFIECCAALHTIAFFKKKIKNYYCSLLSITLLFRLHKERFITFHELRALRRCRAAKGGIHVIGVTCVREAELRIELHRRLHLLHERCLGCWRLLARVRRFVHEFVHNISVERRAAPLAAQRLERSARHKDILVVEQKACWPNVRGVRLPHNVHVLIGGAAHARELLGAPQTRAGAHERSIGPRAIDRLYCRHPAIPLTAFLCTKMN